MLSKSVLYLRTVILHQIGIISKSEVLIPLNIFHSVVAKDAGFAQAALAGLASMENFAKVELRKVGESGPYGGLEPYTDLMLLHVKGGCSFHVHLYTRSIVQ